MKKNIFIVGLDEFNREKLKNLPQAEECDFHAALDFADIRDVETYNIKELIDKAIAAMASFDGPVDGIATFFDFPATDIVPILAAHFHLPGPTLESVLKCENKYWSRVEQRKVIPAHIPRFRAFDPFDDNAFEKIDIMPPYWIKPVKSFKSFLAFQIENKTQFREIMKEVREKIDFIAGKPFRYLMENYGDIPEEIAGMTETCIAESSIGGFQCTLEGYSHEGKIVGYGIVDSIREKNSSSFARYQYPSSLPAEIKERIIEIAAKAIAGIGLDNSPFNIEFFYNQSSDQIFLLEINPRISQAHGDIFEKVHGYSHHHIMVELALGRPPRAMERKGKFKMAGHFMVRAFEDGKVTRTPSEEDMEKVKNLFPETNIKVLVKEGERLSTLAAVQDSYSYEIANLFIGAEDEADLLERYEKIMEILPFNFER